MYGNKLAKCVVVLNDGETYTSLFGCKIIIVPDDVEEHDLDEWIKDNFDTEGQHISTLLPMKRN